MALIPKQRSTSSLVQNIMNQPVFQRAMQRGGSVGRDKRAVGAESKMMGGFVAQERKRLAALDEKGYQLASQKEHLALRRDRLGWQRQLASKRDALVQRRMKSQEEASDLSMTLGGISTVASGFGVYSGWRNRKAATERHTELMDAYRTTRPATFTEGADSFGR